MSADDESHCTVTIMDPEQGVLQVRVPIPPDLIGSHREAFCDGVGDGIAGLANVIWPVV